MLYQHSFPTRRSSDLQGKERGLFFGDYFARSSKHSGAWMTSLRDQERLAGDIRPVIVNVMNFCNAGKGEPVLLSFERSEEHTSELQSHSDLVCRLLLA